jgi:hypothetical protein
MIIVFSPKEVKKLNVKDFKLESSVEVGALVSFRNRFSNCFGFIVGEAWATE